MVTMTRQALETHWTVRLADVRDYGQWPGATAQQALEGAMGCEAPELTFDPAEGDWFASIPGEGLWVVSRA